MTTKTTKTKKKIMMTHPTLTPWNKPESEDDPEPDPDDATLGPEDVGPFEFDKEEARDQIADPETANEAASVDSGADDDNEYIKEGEEAPDKGEETAGSDKDTSDEDNASAPRRSGRVSTRTEVFSPTMSGKLYRTRTLLTVEQRKKGN